MGHPLAACLTGLALVLAGCGGSAAPSDPNSPAASASPTGGATPSVAAEGLAMDCRGEGRPVVVLEAGLDTDSSTFDSLADRLARRHRVCTYDRAGIGQSPPLAAGDPDPWPGAAADALAATLADHGEQAPYVVLGWSYGGLVTQAFATRHPDLVAGVVLEDSSVAQQFVDRSWSGIAWWEGGRPVDKQRTIRALREIDLGDVPLAVLSSDELTGHVRRLWYGYHDRLARASTDAVHVEALGSGHAIHADDERLVAAVVDDVARGATQGTPLAPCRSARYAALRGRCLG
ncbi:alpha/beta fold hydrolase [Nocardioides sp. LS1]|uniref:alpha/beta fold hydrolase n=1 Tax=Nocardioides sp. LS1 TaxID=1027620 RepID=UPI000F628307|nr:alpha/beta hydrolase [Nocardioides sp. LS1]GCD90999.1 hypothetical protein NLS1_30050 [Nocardioides sp. LS1]